MATSKIALGKVRVAMNKGTEVEGNTLIDADGQPTNDPRVMYQSPSGAILPFGGHKGYCLGVIAELFAGALTGGGTYNAASAVTNVIHNNMLSIIFDPEKLGGAASWRDDVSGFVDWVKASPPSENSTGVLVAGEPERITFVERSRNGIPIDEKTWTGLIGAARAVSLSSDVMAATLVKDFGSATSPQDD
jgi:uncharacterized oxidoreductase